MELYTPFLIRDIFRAYKNIGTFNLAALRPFRSYFKMLGLEMRRPIYVPTWRAAFARAYRYPYDKEWYLAQEEVRWEGHFRRPFRIYDQSMESAWQKRMWLINNATPNMEAHSRLPCQDTLSMAWDAVTVFHRGIENEHHQKLLGLDLLMLECMRAGLGLFFPTTEGVIITPIPEDLRAVQSKIMLQKYGRDIADWHLTELPSRLLPRAHMI